MSRDLLKAEWSGFHCRLAMESISLGNWQLAIGNLQFKPVQEGFHDNDFDVLIIGAGPGGSIAASVLHREGFRLLVVEKQQFPRFVIGESLLPRVMNLLREAGLLAGGGRSAVHEENRSGISSRERDMRFRFLRAVRRWLAIYVPGAPGGF